MSIVGTTINSNTYIKNNYNDYRMCGNYRTLFGYLSPFTKSNYFYYDSPTLSSNNYYGILVRLKVLFID